MPAEKPERPIDLLVIGAGPGGYVAAIAAADAGIKTALVEQAAVPGGVCLREGCIPSKTLLHVAHTIDAAAHAKKFGITYAAPALNIDKLRNWKNGVIRKLSSAVAMLIKNRGIEYIRGRAEFENERIVRVDGDEPGRVAFQHCIIATGSRARSLPETILPRALCWNAADALNMETVPDRLLVIGGGYIGLEIGQVYASLGSAVTVVEALDGILTGMDPELAQPLVAKLTKQMKAIHTSASFATAERRGEEIAVTFTVGGAERTEAFDRILVSVGRAPRTDGLALDRIGVSLDDRGFIKVDPQRRTSRKHVFAIGDVAGDPMLAHMAMREAKVAVDAIAGGTATFDPACIPAVVYTDPEVAWCGVTETQAAQQGLDVRVTKFPWAASGRAVTMGRTDGLTKMIFDAQTQGLLGVGIVGVGAGDLIAEGVLAMEMGAGAMDIAGAIHPHPATSETLAEAAAALLGRAIHGDS